MLVKIFFVKYMSNSSNGTDEVKLARDAHKTLSVFLGRKPVAQELVGFALARKLSFIDLIYKDPIMKNGPSDSDRDHVAGNIVRFTGMCTPYMREHANTADDAANFQKLISEYTSFGNSVSIQFFVAVKDHIEPHMLLGLPATLEEFMMEVRGGYNVSGASMTPGHVICETALTHPFVTKHPQIKQHALEFLAEIIHFRIRKLFRDVGDAKCASKMLTEQCFDFIDFDPLRDPASRVANTHIRKEFEKQ